MPNRLANETSPYLLQHKDNPVDWYPWGSEALERARAENKPIFLSIGYSACHWCHVMERESFENADIAALMNREFVNIKVDREERPDLDSIYMTAVQGLTGHGGWPMSVFLTPEGRPFYGGTYFPPEERQGMPAFPTVLTTLAEAYRDRPGDVADSSRQVVEFIRSRAAPQAGAEPLTRDILHEAYRGLAAEFDAFEGGFGTAPKFPQPLVHEFLLRYWRASSMDEPLRMAGHTLEKMARGGMYDHLGGGFHRYSTDRVWLTPHFEKMLYDNALLASLYLHGWLATGAPLYRHIVEGVLTYVLREMTAPDGGFYSAQDADSEGEEGKFFVWRPAEIDGILGAEAGRVVRAYYGVNEAGNFEGKSILHLPSTDEQVADGLGMTAEGLRAVIAEARPRLLAARNERVHPGLDDKVLVAWNGMMIKAFAECGAIFDNRAWIDAARRSAGFLLRELFDGDRLLRTWRRDADGTGRASKLRGYLEDYALLADGLLSLYEATFEPRWLAEATRLADGMIDLFWSPSEEVFYDTGRDHEALVVRPRDVFDNAMPCGGSAAAQALLRLAVFTWQADYARRASASLRSVAELMARAPGGFGHWLGALDFYLSTPQEVALIGPADDPATKALRSVVFGRYSPNRVVAGASERMEPALSPLLEGRGLLDGRPTAYVCEDYACQSPVTDPEALASQLAGSPAER